MWPTITSHVSIAAILLSACNGKDTGADFPGGGASADSVFAVHVDTVREQVIAVRTIHGSYDQTPRVLTELATMAKAAGLVGGAPYGIFPMDPDTAASDSFRWEIALPLDAAPTRTLPEPYRVDTLQPGLTLRVESTVAASHRDGRRMKEWMARSEYVQEAPTRMAFLGGPSPLEQKVDIIFPVRVRPGLADPARSASRIQR